MAGSVPVTDEELMRWLVRSMGRLKRMAETRSYTEHDIKWIQWHDRLVAECQRRSLLPAAPITNRTEIGRQVGAF